jgi:hypothetical protein
MFNIFCKQLLLKVVDLMYHFSCLSATNFETVSVSFYIIFLERNNVTGTYFVTVVSVLSPQ